MRRQFATCVLSACAIFGGAAQAAPTTYTAALSGPAEAPPNASPGTGSATVVHDPDAHTLRVSADFSDLLSPTTVAHIHCCVEQPGTASPATAVPSFPGFPVGVTAGSYDRLFDLTDAASFNPAFVELAGGTLAAAEAALAAGLDAGQAYLNIHTELFPGGEIRGFLNALPEPATLSLLGVALIGLAIGRARPARPVLARPHCG